MFCLVESALSSKAFAASDQIFQRGNMTASMYIVKDGVLLYSMSTKTAQVDVHPKDWMCETCLWVTWACRGDCHATTECEIIIIDAQAFGTAMHVDEAIWLLMSAYAEVFTEWLNQIPFQDLSDVFLNRDGTILGEELLESAHKNISKSQQ